MAPEKGISTATPSLQRIHTSRIVGFVAFALLLFGIPAASAGPPHDGEGDHVAFPPPLEYYDDAEFTSVWDILRHRVEVEPFNLWATLIFFAAITHTFLTARFRRLAHRLEERHQQRLRDKGLAADGVVSGGVCASARLFHFLGEVEAVFGIWVIPLMLSMNALVGHPAAQAYLSHGVKFTEATFVVVIMTIASTRPILELAERILRVLARLGGESPVAWWVVLLTVGPLLGSFITEPAAMIICASLLARKFYVLQPSRMLAYSTLGLLFVAVSVGGTLTHFAAPPVLMVAHAWDWDLAFMLCHFGWKAALGIGLSALAYYAIFRGELRRLGTQAARHSDDVSSGPPIPWWVTVGHVAFMVFAVIEAHHPPQLVFGVLFFLAFVEVTEEFQHNFTLRPPILVGFFLAGLVVHGGLQGWWIAPVLGSLGELPLMLSATVLTAFNDNAAITYLCTLVPTFSAGMQYAAVAGAVSGGGLTVIANAPNPAGQSILNKHFSGGIGPMGLLAGAIVPTLIVGLLFMLLR